MAVEATLAGNILVQAQQQLQTSRMNKRARLEQIKENEDLYHGIAEKNIRNPFSECFPFMAGFVDHMKAKIEDDSDLSYNNDDNEADFKICRKIQAHFDKTSRSVLPNDSWNLKHRYAKTNAIFSGVAIYKYWSVGSPAYKSFLYVVSHYDFHFEARGGGMIDNHLFCGEDSVYKNIEDLEGDAVYDQTQVAKLKLAAQNGTKDTNAEESLRDNRAQAMLQDPRTNNYVGQGVVKLTEWYTTFKGLRYYLLFSDETSTWIRCELLIDILPDNQWPYVVWQTNEDPDVLFSKAPCDDARPVAKIINTMINQELYNRQKMNFGETHYDVDMYPNVAALVDTRPDKYVPVDTLGGKRPLSSGIYKVQVGALTGTLDIVTWLDQFTGRQTGNTPGSQGDSEGDKKATVFVGEIQQVEQLIGIKNKSFRDALSRLGLRYKTGLEYNLSTPEAVKVMGGKGAEWVELSKEEVKRVSSLRIQPVGGTSDLQLKKVQDNEKKTALGVLQTVNPQWKERQILLLSGFEEDDVKDAFSANSFATRELLSEAAMAEEDIVAGKKPKLNRGATADFMQHIIDFATNTDNLSTEIHGKLIDYAMEHTDIVLANLNRDVKKMLADRAAQALSTPLNERMATVSSGATMTPNGAVGGPTDQVATPPGNVPGGTQLQ